MGGEDQPRKEPDLPEGSCSLSSDRPHLDTLPDVEGPSRVETPKTYVLLLRRHMLVEVV